MACLHLDLKGTIPAPDQFQQWLRWFRSCGYHTLYLEFDHQAAWKTWDFAGTKRYLKDDIRALTEFAVGLGFQMIPVIQILGHMEWLLKLEKWAYLRENNKLNSICPCHPDSMKLIKQWIDEVVELFPASKHIHLGGDETWNLGTCPACQEVIKNDPLQRGEMGLYTDHVAELCRYVVEEKHKTPMIWNDMFCRDTGKSMEYLRDFPSETVFVHWKYADDVEEHLQLFRNSGCNLLGASALRCNWKGHENSMLFPYGDRFRNLEQWQKQNMTVIHTVWTRPNSVRPIYGTWAPLVPLFIAAADPEAWKKHPWFGITEKIDAAVNSRDPAECLTLAEKILSLPVGNDMEEEARHYLSLALRFEALHTKALDLFLQQRVLGEMERFDFCDTNKKAALDKIKKSLLNDVAIWEKELAAYWKKYKWSDFEEYKACRLAGLIY